MKIEDFTFTDWHYSAQENGMETRARIAFCDGLASVLKLFRSERSAFISFLKGFL